jgi:hypothetical protein
LILGCVYDYSLELSCAEELFEVAATKKDVEAFRWVTEFPFDPNDDPVLSVSVCLDKLSFTVFPQGLDWCKPMTRENLNEKLNCGPNLCTFDAAERLRTRKSFGILGPTWLWSKERSRRDQNSDSAEHSDSLASHLAS